MGGFFYQKVQEMTKKAKLLERIRNNPKDVKFKEVQQY